MTARLPRGALDHPAARPPIRRTAPPGHTHARKAHREVPVRRPRMTQFVPVPRWVTSHLSPSRQRGLPAQTAGTPRGRHPARRQGDDPNRETLVHQPVYTENVAPMRRANSRQMAVSPGQAGAVTRLRSTTASSTGTSTYSPPASVMSGPTAG